jgi:hypothetical protein
MLHLNGSCETSVRSLKAREPRIFYRQGGRGDPGSLHLPSLPALLVGVSSREDEGNRHGMRGKNIRSFFDGPDFREAIIIDDNQLSCCWLSRCPVPEIILGTWVAG